MSRLLQEAALAGEDVAWLKEYRGRGRERFAAQGIPSAKTEAWKYTKPNMFLQNDLVYQQVVDEVRNRPELPFETYKISFVNGIFAPQLSNLPPKIEILPMIEAAMFYPEAQALIGKLTDTTKHPFAALNDAYFNEGCYIRLEANTALDKPIALMYHTTQEARGGMMHLHNLIVLESGAKAELIEQHSYEGEVKLNYFANIVNEIRLETKAQLQHYKYQNEAFKAVHIALNVVNVKSGGIYKSFCLQKGADLARNETQVVLSEPEAEAQVNAAYMMNGWATLDTTTDIEHTCEKTFSSQLVKGVVGGQAKGVFQGKIHIAPLAAKTQGYQQHRALLLSDEAEVDVKPELEIFADDVKCSHGAACGQLDAEQLFYMRSRGIGEEEAKAMLIDAYLDEVIAKVDNEKVSEWIKSLLKM
ncbi:MAG: Fe-S cluster assembly protein SufD [Alphaproteobacteria bacterium]|nr:Fe-S cluster assembly protein SufD [Alphaproteobacteria bacterium]